jgi:hypothetical protein
MAAEVSERILSELASLKFDSGFNSATARRCMGATPKKNKSSDIVGGKGIEFRQLAFA